MTLKDAKAGLRKLGITLTKRDGEYRVNLAAPWGCEASAYYTDDIGDAVRTGVSMAQCGEEMAAVLAPELVPPPQPYCPGHGWRWDGFNDHVEYCEEPCVDPSRPPRPPTPAPAPLRCSGEGCGAECPIHGEILF